MRQLRVYVPLSLLAVALSVAAAKPAGKTTAKPAPDPDAP